jgi:hypothetical protein
LLTLAALISGIVGSKSTQLPHIAAKVPNGTNPDSRVKRFARWCDNAHILEEVYFLPYAEVLLRHLALQTLQQFPPMAPISYVTMMSEQSAGDLTSIWL